MTKRKLTTRLNLSFTLIILSYFSSTDAFIFHNSESGENIVYGAKIVIPEDIYENKSTAILRLILTVNKTDHELFRGTTAEFYVRLDSEEKFAPVTDSKENH